MCSSDLYCSAVREAVEILIALVAPITPHLAEECSATLGNNNMIATSPWPVYDEVLVIENEIIYPVQINGKKRAELTIARDADQNAVQQAVLGLDAVKSALNDQAPKKIIVVPQRIVNIVV